MGKGMVDQKQDFGSLRQQKSQKKQHSCKFLVQGLSRDFLMRCQRGVDLLQETGEQR